MENCRFTEDNTRASSGLKDARFWIYRCFLIERKANIQQTFEHLRWNWKNKKKCGEHKQKTRMTVNCEVRNFKKEKGSKVKPFVLGLFLPDGTFPHSSCRSGWRCICSAVWLFLVCIMCDKGRCDMLSIVYLHEISSIIWICLFKEFVACGGPTMVAFCPSVFHFVLNIFTEDYCCVNACVPFHRWKCSKLSPF